MKLTDIGTVRELMGENTFKKKFGQNFLINEAVPKRIAEEGACEGVLEIGPGIGTLTVCLCEKAKRVVAVEIDTTLMPILDKTLADYNNVEVINGDIMKTDVKTLVSERFTGCESVSVCANLPYYITSPVLMYLLESHVGFRKITVMVQKEVADRLCAKPGSDDYGAISAVCAYYGNVKKLFNVSAGSFMPKPKVDSAVVQISLYENPPVDVDENIFFAVIKGAFGQRRKTLLNALSAAFSDIPKQKLAELIENCSLSPTVRGETLGITEFAILANKISAYRGK